MAIQGNHYITFAIICEAMEDPSFQLGETVHICNEILKYLYIGLLIMSLLLSLGNRPQAAKWFYVAGIIGFAVIAAYMMVSCTDPSNALYKTSQLSIGSWMYHHREGL